MGEASVISLLLILANKFSFGIMLMGVTKTVCGSPFAKMSTF